MPDDWPDDDVLLMLARESAEHKRAWALIAGLSKTILKERQNRPVHVSKKLKGDKPEDWSDRIQTLEQKIINQKSKIRTLEECRAFELETEQMLVTALREINVRATGSIAMISDTILTTFEERRGPRPVDNVTQLRTIPST